MGLHGWGRCGRFRCCGAAAETARVGQMFLRCTARFLSKGQREMSRAMKRVAVEMGPSLFRSYEIMLPDERSRPRLREDCLETYRLSPIAIRPSPRPLGGVVNWFALLQAGAFRFQTCLASSSTAHNLWVGQRPPLSFPIFFGPRFVSALFFFFSGSPRGRWFIESRRQHARRPSLLWRPKPVLSGIVRALATSRRYPSLILFDDGRGLASLAVSNVARF